MTHRQALRSAFILTLTVALSFMPALAAPYPGAPQAHAQTETACAAGIKPMIKDDRTVPAVWRDTSELVFGLSDAARVDLPDALGPVPAGEAWMIGSVQQAGVPWLGANTQHPSLAAHTTGDVTWEITGYDGPGAVYVFTQGGLGELVGEEWFRADASGAQGTHTIPANSHVHPSWVFSEPGAHYVTITQTARTNTGETVSATATLTFNAGGQGNADDGHYDFGTVVCDGGAGDTADAAGASAPESDAAATGTRAAQGGQAGSARPSASGAAPAAAQPKKSAAGGEKKCTPGLKPMVKDDRSVPAEWKDPATLTFGLSDAARTELPEALGPVPAGTAWMIGSTQQAGVPWLGANTQHESLLEHTTGDVTWEITGFDGPGAFYLFTQGGLGEIVGEEWFSAADGQGKGSHTIPANSHVHPSWVFSKPGTYKITIRQSATAKDGKDLTGSATLTFEVGGAGNADEGHFDFGTAYDAEGDCGAGAGAAAGAGAGASGGGAPGALADTGTTVMTLPFAMLGLGLLVFGAGLVTLDSRLRRRLLGALGAGQ